MSSDQTDNFVRIISGAAIATRRMGYALADKLNSLGLTWTGKLIEQFAAAAEHFHPQASRSGQARIWNFFDSSSLSWNGKCWAGSSAHN